MSTHLTRGLTGKQLSTGVFAWQAPTPNTSGSRSPRRPGCVVWHIAEGSAASALSWLRSPVSQASSSYLVAATGDVFQLLPDNWIPWTNGDSCNPNVRNPVVANALTEGYGLNDVALTVECAGHSSHGQGGSLTGLQVDSLIRLTAHLCIKHAITADPAHIFGHSDWNACTRYYCPGFSPEEWDMWREHVRRLAYAARGW